MKGCREMGAAAAEDLASGQRWLEKGHVTGGLLAVGTTTSAFCTWRPHVVTYVAKLSAWCLNHSPVPPPLAAQSPLPGGRGRSKWTQGHGRARLPAGL